MGVPFCRGFSASSADFYPQILRFLKEKKLGGIDDIEG